MKNFQFVLFCFVLNKIKKLNIKNIQFLYLEHQLINASSQPWGKSAVQNIL